MHGHAFPRISTRAHARPAARRYGFEENDIYPLEVCLLHEMCRNGGDIFARRTGEPFDCVVDLDRWHEASLALLQEPPNAWE